MNVLFVSNSTCQFFTDELYGIFAAAGLEDVTLALVYYGGCSVRQHYEWSQDKTVANYQLRIIDKNGLGVTSDYSLDRALDYARWDVISFDNNAKTFGSGKVETALGITEPYFGQLLSYIKEKYPDARYLWHEVWANDIGYSAPSFKVETAEKRTSIFKAKQGVMYHMMETYGIGGVPTGDAWEKVRDLPLFTTPLPEFTGVTRFALTSRIANGEFKDDYSHDGDVGGGQYLNACVWFEILSGRSCVGNTFRPKYQYKGHDVSLTDEKTAILQNAAHEAVEEFKKSIAE